MPIVFDQVVGTVAPETPPAATGEQAPVLREPPAENLQLLLRQMEQRARRLRAD